MDIKEFVKSTITQISEAVNELNQELTDGTVVNPSCVDYHKKASVGVLGATVEEIVFDLSVSVSDSAGSEGKVGLFATVIGVGASAKEGIQNESVSKIKFSIPVMLPHKRPYD